jgi:hypothetical protein
LSAERDRKNFEKENKYSASAGPVKTAEYNTRPPRDR